MQAYLWGSIKHGYIFIEEKYVLAGFFCNWCAWIMKISAYMYLYMYLYEKYLVLVYLVLKSCLV